MADSIIIAAVCIIGGAVVGFALQPRVDKPRTRQVAVTPEPEPVGATVGEIGAYKQQKRKGKKGAMR